MNIVKKVPQRRASGSSQGGDQLCNISQQDLYSNHINSARFGLPLHFRSKEVQTFVNQNNHFSMYVCQRSRQVHMEGFSDLWLTVSSHALTVPTVRIVSS